MKELEIDYMEDDHVRIKGHKRNHGTYKDLKVVVRSHMMLFELVKIVNGNFMSFVI